MNEVAALREEIETLREINRQLREAITPCGVEVPDTLPPLSRSEVAVFRCLVRSQVATPEMLRLALYSDRAQDWPGDGNIVSVFVCRIRRKLRPLGINIRTHWGHGYSLDDRERFLVSERAS